MTLNHRMDSSAGGAFVAEECGIKSLTRLAVEDPRSGPPALVIPRWGKRTINMFQFFLFRADRWESPYWRSDRRGTNILTTLAVAQEY